MSTCPTPGCEGDARYAAPGRRHRPGCTHPRTDSVAPTPAEVEAIAEVLAAFIRPATHDETCSPGCFAEHGDAHEAAAALLTSPVLADLLARARGEGRAEGWDEGYRAGDLDGSRNDTGTSRAHTNPYPADRQEQP